MILLKDTTQWRQWAWTRGPLVSSRALYHWATALPLIPLMPKPRLHLSTSNGIVYTKIYDKRDDFYFEVVNFPL